MVLNRVKLYISTYNAKVFCFRYDYCYWNLQSAVCGSEFIKEPFCHWFLILYGADNLRVDSKSQ